MRPNPYWKNSFFVQGFSEYMPDILLQNLSLPCMNILKTVLRQIEVKINNRNQICFLVKTVCAILPLRNASACHITIA